MTVRPTSERDHPLTTVHQPFNNLTLRAVSLQVRIRSLSRNRGMLEPYSCFTLVLIRVHHSPYHLNLAHPVDQLQHPQSSQSVGVTYSPPLSTSVSSGIHLALDQYFGGQRLTSAGSLLGVAVVREEGVQHELLQLEEEIYLGERELGTCLCKGDADLIDPGRRSIHAEQCGGDDSHRSKASRTEATAGSETE